MNWRVCTHVSIFPGTYPVLILVAGILLIGCGGNRAISTIAVTPTPTPKQKSVDLSWEPSVSSVIGYNVYRGTTPGGPYPLKLNSSPQPGAQFVDHTVSSGTYYYVATSLDPDSVESSYSNEVKAVVP